MGKFQFIFGSWKIDHRHCWRKKSGQLQLPVHVQGLRGGEGSLVCLMIPEAAGVGVKAARR